METATGNPFYMNFDLAKTAGAWTGTLMFLPKDKGLTFTAHAFNSNDTEIFSGSTDQTLSMDNENVSITLVPFDEGGTITLPQILKISIPSEFASGQSSNLSFYVQGNTGEQLSYVLTAEAGGGLFLPVNGTTTLAATTGTFVSRYLAPTVAAMTEYTHEVKVTNASEHSVKTTFKTKVLPPEATQGVRNTTISVLFNPVIQRITASRVLGTGNVIWEAVVADDGPAEALAYQWGFVPNGTFEPAPVFTGQTNPATLQNYTTAVEGTVTLAVIAAGGMHTCALLSTGNIRCWGLGAHGQLGYGNGNSIGDNEVPSAAGDVSVGGSVLQIAPGGYHTCALLSTGAVKCWGDNANGELGYGDTTDRLAPTSSTVNLSGVTVYQIAAGRNHTCVLLNTDRARCWGYNGYGQLGYGHTSRIYAPSTAGDINVFPPAP